MSSYFLNSLFSKYQPGEAWYPSGFEPLGPVGRAGKNGSEPGTSPGAGWRCSSGSYGATYDGTNSSSTTGAANCAMSGTSFPGTYGYSACAFSQAYSQTAGYQDQFGGGYPPGYAPTTFAPSWTQASKVVASNSTNYGIEAVYCSSNSRDIHGDHDEKDSASSPNSEKKDGPPYKGPVYNWMKIPGKLSLLISYKVRISLGVID